MSAAACCHVGIVTISCAGAENLVLVPDGFCCGKTTLFSSWMVTVKFNLIEDPVSPGNRPLKVICCCVYCSDHHGRRLAQVVVMDAKKYFDPLSQFNDDDIRRELNKVGRCILQNPLSRRLACKIIYFGAFYFGEFQPHRDG